MCGGKGLFQVEDLPVGPRWFCTEKHFAEYAGLPVKEFGYYGFEAESFEAMTEKDGIIVCDSCNNDVESDRQYGTLTIECGNCGNTLYQDDSYDKFDMGDFYGAESFEAEGELEREYFTRFGDERGGKEWGEYNFTWFNDVGDWKPIDEDTTGWDEDDYADFREQKEYELVNDMLSDSYSELYRWIENHEIGNQKELYTSYEVLNEDGKKEVLGLLISWEEPEDVEQTIQYYKKEPFHKLEFLAESFEASSKWAGWCPKCSKWRTKQMSYAPSRYDIRDGVPTGIMLCAKKVRRGGYWKNMEGRPQFCDTPLSKKKGGGGDVPYIPPPFSPNGRQIQMSESKKLVQCKGHLPSCKKMIDPNRTWWIDEKGEEWPALDEYGEEGYCDDCIGYSIDSHSWALAQGHDAESFEAMSLNEEHICFICGATKEDIEGVDDMMSTKGGDACKTCAEEYGYEWPDDMIYLDAESFAADEANWDGDNLKCRRCYKFSDFRYFEDVSVPVYVGEFCPTCAEEMQSASDEVGKYLGRYETKFGFRNRAEEKKLPPVEKAIDTGIASGATMEGLDLALGAEEPSVYYWVKTEMQNRHPITEPDLDQILHMVSLNVPITDIEYGMEQAEEMGDEPTYIMLELAHRKAKFIKKYQAEEDDEDDGYWNEGEAPWRESASKYDEFDESNPFSLSNLLWLNNHGGVPKLNDGEHYVLKKLKSLLYNWDGEPEYSDVFQEDLQKACGDYPSSLKRTLNSLSKKGLIDVQNVPTGEYKQTTWKFTRDKDGNLIPITKPLIYPKPLMVLYAINMGWGNPEWLQYALDDSKKQTIFHTEEYKVADEDWAGQSCEDCYEEIKLGDSVHDDGYVLICKKCYSNYKIPCSIEACDERFKNKEEEGEHRQESCDECEGHGWIMTSYTPATYHDPAEADGHDCEVCDGEGLVCFNAESLSAESNGDLQLDESKKRTKMSAIRTGLAITTFGIVLFNLWTNKKQEKDISDIMDLV